MTPEDLLFCLSFPYMTLKEQVLFVKRRSAPDSKEYVTKFKLVRTTSMIHATISKKTGDRVLLFSPREVGMELGTTKLMSNAHPRFSNKLKNLKS